MAHHRIVDEEHDAEKTKAELTPVDRFVIRRLSSIVVVVEILGELSSHRIELRIRIIQTVDE